MAIPSTQAAWHLPEVAQRKNISALKQVKDAQVKPPGPGEVLVRVHAVSLNYRDYSELNSSLGSQAPGASCCLAEQMPASYTPCVRMQ